MSKQQLHIDQLFRRYLQGDIGPREEAELEGYAQEDEALASAMQAIREQPMLDHAAAVERIKSRLPRAARKKTLLVYRWVAAACLLLAVGASLLWLPEWRGNSQGEMVMQLSEKQDATTPAVAVAEEAAVVFSDTLADVVPTDLGNNPKTNQPARLRKEPPPTIPPTADEPAESEMEALADTPVPRPAETAISAQSADQAEETAAVAPSTKRIAAAPPSPLAVPSAANTAPSGSAVDNGIRQRIPSVAAYVTNEEGEPIADVEVLLAGQPMGVRTDSSGFFVLKGIQGSERITLIHPNYQRFTLSLGRAQSEQQIVLEALQEAAETDWMLESARTTIYPNRPRSFAYPVQGMKALKQAIIQQIPTELRQGKLRISFTVDATGQLSNFSAADDTPPALLENVRNYLQQNSRWQISGEDAVEVSLLLRW